jgi:hypothetical protein
MSEVEVICPDCGFVAVWLWEERRFAPAPDIIRTCPEIRALFNLHPKLRFKSWSDPRVCDSMERLSLLITEIQQDEP